MAIELAQEDFQDSRPLLDADNATALTNTQTKLPPNYCVLRAGSQTPESFRAASDEDAMAIVRRQVRSGQVKIVYLYKMMCAEEWVSHSTTLSMEDILERQSVITQPIVETK